jgi:putative ABC transport system permease protein
VTGRRAPLAPTPEPALERPLQAVPRLLRDSRVGWRQLVADPLASAIVVLGLALAIACCQLLAQMVLNEVLPDRHVADPDRVVSLELRADEAGWRERVPAGLGDALRGELPPAALATRASEQWLRARAGERTEDLGVAFVDPQAMRLFGLAAERGDLAATLRLPDTIALTRPAAVRLFGRADVLGRTLRLHGHVLAVAAVLSYPSRTLMRGAEALASFDSPANLAPGMGVDHGAPVPERLHARLVPGQSADDFGRLAQSVFDRGEKDAAGRHQTGELRAVPVTQVWLGGANAGARRLKLYGLVAIAALILVLAAANYVNLSMVRTLARSREIAVRKSLGADPRRLVRQFVLESSVTAACAVALGVLLAWLLAPGLGDLLAVDLDDGLLDPPRLAALAVFALVLGAVTGLVPARIALRVRCAETLAGRPHDEGAGGRRLRRALTALQFTIALVVSGGACVSTWQGRHVDALDPGFRVDGLVTVDLPDDAPAALAGAFRDAVARQPGVTGAAWSSDVPGRGRVEAMDPWRRVAGGPVAKAQASVVDAGFFGLYGIAPVAGRVPVSDGGGERLLVIDTAAAHALGFANPRDAVDARLVGLASGAPLRARIVAVVPALRQVAAREAPPPRVFQLAAGPQATLTLAGADPDALKLAIEAAWPVFFPDERAQPQAVLESLQRRREDERRIGRLALFASLFAQALAGLGVYALAAYTVRRSLREIVVRRLYGAGHAHIALVLARDFAPLLLAAALAGLPLTAWLIRAWLAGYAERTPLAWWSLPAALLAVVATTVLATWRHGLAAMRVRPAQAVRD